MLPYPDAGQPCPNSRYQHAVAAQVAVRSQIVDGLSGRPVYGRILFFLFWYSWSQSLHLCPITGSDIWPHGKHLHSFSNCITTEICGYKFRFLTAWQRALHQVKALYITPWWMSHCRGILCGSCLNNTWYWGAAPTWTFKSFTPFTKTTISV